MKTKKENLQNIRIEMIKNPFSTGDEYAYRVYVDEKRLSAIGLSYDEALLIGLEYKYLGLNSQFSQFAMKMLEIPMGE